MTGQMGGGGNLKKRTTHYVWGNSNNDRLLTIYINLYKIVTNNNELLRKKSLQRSRRQCVHMYSYLVSVKSVVTLCTNFAQPTCLAVQMNCQDA